MPQEKYCKTVMKNIVVETTITPHKGLVNGSVDNDVVIQLQICQEDCDEGCGHQKNISLRNKGGIGSCLANPKGNPEEKKE